MDLRMFADSPARRLPTYAGRPLMGGANPLRIIIIYLRGAAPVWLITKPRDPQGLEALHPLVDEAAADTHGARDVRDGSPFCHEQDDSAPSG